MNKFLKNNSSTILTVVGSAGVIVTAIMSARDTLKARKRIQYQRGYQDKEFNIKEKIKIAASCYIPTVISGVSTILCICGANKINKNVQKSLTSAYVLLDQSYKEYKNSVRDIYGEDGVMKVTQNIVDKRREESSILEQPDGEILVFELFDMRFFNSSLSSLESIEEAANEILSRHGYLSLNDLHAMLNLGPTDTGNMLGWSIDAGKRNGYERIEIQLTKTTRADGMECYILDFADGPTADYLG